MLNLGQSVRAQSRSLPSIFTKRSRKVRSSNRPKIVPIVMVHGGSDNNISDKILWNFKNSVKLAARFGYAELIDTKDVTAAVVEAVSRLEQDPLFNAGYGSSASWDSSIVMDASVMRGQDLNCGSVSLVRNIMNPVQLAAHVMNYSNQTCLAGEELMEFAFQHDFERVNDHSLYTQKTLEDLNKVKEVSPSKYQIASPAEDEQRCTSSGAVGAIAIDENGNVACATSAGGPVGKMAGRIGESAVLGAASYADNAVGCISSTGHGEALIRFNVAYRILSRMQYLQCSPYDAAKFVLDMVLKRFKKPAGVVAIDTLGQVGIYFNGVRMPWAYQRGTELHYGVDQNEDQVEQLRAHRYVN